jgi:hypothetical protein
MDEKKNMYKFNRIAPLDDEEHISWLPSSTDKALSLQESPPCIDYEGLVDFITTRYVTTTSKLNSTRSPSPSTERSMTSFSPPRTGSRSLCDTGPDILTNLQPKALNFRIIDSEKPTLDFVCAEHNSKRTLEVLPMQTDEFLAETESFDIIKSSSSTSTDSFFGCEELKFPHDRDLSSRSISTHAELAAPNNSTGILNIDGQVNQEERKCHKKSKKKKTETKKKIETVANNSQTGWEAYNEQHCAEIKRRGAKTTVKKGDLKDRETSKVNTNTEIEYMVRVQSVHDRTGKGLMSHNDCPKTMTVRAQFAARQSYLGKDQNRNLGHNRENFGNEAKQTDFRNATVLSTLNAAQQSRNVGKKKSYSENAHRQKVASGPKELVFSNDTFTLPQIVRETTEPLHNQSRRAKRTTKNTQQTKTLSTNALYLPPIEKNNFVIAKTPTEIHSSRTVENQISPNMTKKVFAKKESMDNFNNQHWGQLASNKTDSSLLKSSVRRKSRYDRDVLENRVKVPPFDTRCDQEIKVRFPQI